MTNILQPKFCHPGGRQVGCPSSAFVNSQWVVVEVGDPLIHFQGEDGKPLTLGADIKTVRNNLASRSSDMQ